MSHDLHFGGHIGLGRQKEKIQKLYLKGIIFWNTPMEIDQFWYFVRLHEIQPVYLNTWPRSMVKVTYLGHF